MTKEQKRPNIVFLFSDQQRWDTLGCYGQPLDVTPNLDRLAGEGIRFFSTQATMARTSERGTPNTKGRAMTAAPISPSLSKDPHSPAEKRLMISPV